MKKGANLSTDRIYRYSLWRIWDSEKPYVLFIGLNPSKADENEDDPTIRRCINFATDWGYGGIYMANLFAFRATQRKHMKKARIPIGGLNDLWLKELAGDAAVIVCAWGTDGIHQGRDKEVKILLKNHNLKCLEITKHGHPKHPLYIKADTKLIDYKNNSI